MDLTELNQKFKIIEGIEYFMFFDSFHIIFIPVDVKKGVKA